MVKKQIQILLLFAVTILMIAGCYLPGNAFGNNTATLRIILPGDTGRAVIGEDSVQRILTYGIKLTDPGGQIVSGNTAL